MGQAGPRKTLEASEFVLRDRAGNVRARLSVDEKTSVAQFVLFTKEGIQQLKLASGFAIDGGGLTVADERGKDKVFLSSNRTLGGTLSLLDEKGTTTVLYPDWAEFSTVAVKGAVRTPNLAIFAKDDDHVPRAMFSVSEDGDAQLSLESKGKQILMLGPRSLEFLDSKVNPTALAAHAPSGLYIVDDQGFAVSVGAADLVTPRTGEMHKTSAASIVLFDKNKNVLWRAP